MNIRFNYFKFFDMIYIIVFFLIWMKKIEDSLFYQINIQNIWSVNFVTTCSQIHFVYIVVVIHSVKNVYKLVSSKKIVLHVKAKYS